MFSGTCTKVQDITSSKSRDSITSKQPEELDRSSKLWKTSSVKRLIDLHIENEHKFNKQGCKKKVIWQEITDQINIMGNNFNYQQVEQKWKNLTKSFRATVDHNNKSGNDKKECPFFKELEEAYGYKANVKPVFTLGSITKDNDFGSDNESVAESDSLGNSETSDSPPTKRKTDCLSISEDTPQKQAKKKTSHVFTLMETMREDYKKEQEELLSELKKQHCDKMEKEDKKLELMSQMVALMKK